jgi:uncharacterized membrane protein
MGLIPGVGWASELLLNREAQVAKEPHGSKRRETFMHYMPLALPFVLAFFFLFVLLVILVEIGILGYAYQKIGVNRRYVFALLFLSLLGSYVNIPVAELPAEHIHSGRVVTFYGMRYMVPMVMNWPKTVIAVNVGGAVIPFILSLYLIIKNRLYFRSLLAVVVVAGVCHYMAYPVPGVGIAEPIFIPPLLTAGLALLISREHAPPLAYVAGSLGVLIGADVLNLDKIRGLGAPVASIGGAGTFDGIFLTGIVAVLLASLIRRKPSKSQAGDQGQRQSVEA